MKIDKEIYEYLSGVKFSNSLIFKIEDRIPERRRVDLITSLARDKRIIHLGCLDHIPLIKDKMKGNTWLHGLLTEASEICLGIDINKEGIEYAQKELGIHNIVYGDILHDEIPETQEIEKWDFLILGEILEHIDNPISFLSNIRTKYEGKVEKIVITVPNVLTFQSMKGLKKAIENVNSDHRYWFTPYTISKVMHRAGFRIENIDFANRIQLSTLQLSIRKIRSLFNMKSSYPFSFYSSIVIIGSFK
jgi:hypothetical protein